jgi:hypothetical protein
VPNLGQKYDSEERKSQVYSGDASSAPRPKNSPRGMAKREEQQRSPIAIKTETNAKDVSRHTKKNRHFYIIEYQAVEFNFMIRHLPPSTIALVSHIPGSSTPTDVPSSALPPNSIKSMDAFVP